MFLKRMVGLAMILAPFIWVLWSLISVWDWQGLLLVVGLGSSIVASVGVGVWLFLAEE